jgi:hypothetical protein
LGYEFGYDLYQRYWKGFLAAQDKRRLKNKQAFGIEKFRNTYPWNKETLGGEKASKAFYDVHGHQNLVPLAKEYLRMIKEIHWPLRRIY